MMNGMTALPISDLATSALGDVLAPSETERAAIPFSHEQTTGISPAGAFEFFENQLSDQDGIEVAFNRAILGHLPL